MKSCSSRLTVGQYAARRGVTRAAVYKALAERRIVRTPDGRIDPVAADAAWSANTAPTMRWQAGGGPVRPLTDAEMDRLVEELLG